MTMFRTTIPSLACLAAVACGAAAESDEPTGTSEAAIALPNAGQGWTPRERTALTHLPTGTRYIKYEWFKALEQPGSAHLFSEPAFARSFGLLVDEQDRTGLPVGFAVSRSFVDVLEAGDYVGTSCMACHTSELRYRGATVRIDGAAGAADIIGYLTAIYEALQETRNDRAKLARFADRLGVFEFWIGPQIALALDEIRVNLLGNTLVAEGPGRADATARGVNTIFGPLSSANRMAVEAPLRIPSLWGTHRFDYRHYQGAIGQSLARDVSNVLSSGGELTRRSGSYQYRSNVAIDNLHELESKFAKLEAPLWPEAMLGKVDRDRAALGREHFQRLCSSCHDPVAHGSRLALEVIPVEQIGTDPVAARRASGTVDTGAMGFGIVPGARALFLVTEGVINRWFDDQGTPQSDRARYLDGPNVWRATDGYKATPLAGVWASAPYLHNGSVPSLRQLLTRASERVATFHTGGVRDYDPVDVGIGGAPAQGFLVDTRIAGNRNTGHEYGVDLREEEKDALIEYLKTR